MKTWIKRTLIAFTASAALLGGIGAWAHQRHGGWHAMSSMDAAEMKTRIVERVSQQLTLDANQKARLGTLADAMRDQHVALKGSAADPRAELQALIAGNTFDRTQAGALIASKLKAVNERSPAVVTAFGDFYDSLRADQQAQVRQFMARRGGHHGERGEHSERGEHGSQRERS